MKICLEEYTHLLSGYIGSYMRGFYARLIPSLKHYPDYHIPSTVFSFMWVKVNVYNLLIGY